MDIADPFLRELQDVGIITGVPDLPGRKRKEPTNATIPSGKRRKTDFGAQERIIRYIPSHEVLYDNDPFDYILEKATLLPADAVLEPTGYWFVSPIELEITPSPLIQLVESVQLKDYYLYHVVAYLNGQAEFCDTSGKLLAQVEWEYGASDRSLKSDERQHTRNKFTQPDQSKQQAPNTSYSADSTNNRFYGTNSPSFNEVPDAYKTFLYDDGTKTVKQPQTTAPFQSSYSAPSYESYLPSSYAPDTKQKENIGSSNERRIPFSQIKLGEVIGEGSYGVIYYAEYNKQKHAIKRFKYYEAKKEDALKEAEVLLKLRHKRIVSMVGITTDPKTDEIMLVMEYMENGSLEDLLVRDKVQLSRDDVIKIGLDIAKGLHFLHAQKIIHRDLKSANVLLYDNKKRAKLSDFGTVRIFGASSKATTIIGTMGFIAPEILCEIPYGAKADVYSFGVLLYHMLTLKMFPAMFQDPTQVSTRIKDHVKDIQFQELIINCCKREPDERPSIDDCIASLVKIQYQIKA